MVPIDNFVAARLSPIILSPAILPPAIGVSRLTWVNPRVINHLRCTFTAPSLHLRCTFAPRSSHFVVLTLAFGVNKKVSTPTTVVIMGLNSMVGFFVHGVVLQDIGIAWELAGLCAGCDSGDTLGGLCGWICGRDTIIYLLLGLIFLELVTTMILIPFTPSLATQAPHTPSRPEIERALAANAKADRDSLRSD